MKYLDIVPFSIPFNVLGTGVNSPYPVLARVSTFKYNVPIGIINYQFSAAVRVDNSGDPVVIALVLNQDAPTMRIGQDSQVIGSWSVAGQTALLDTAKDISFATDWNEMGFKVPTQMPVSIYIAAPNNIDYVMSGVVTLYTILTS